MTFKKGQSGNPDKKFKPGNSFGKGQPKKLPELDKLLAEVLGERKDGIEAAQVIATEETDRAIDDE